VKPSAKVFGKPDEESNKEESYENRHSPTPMWKRRVPHPGLSKQQRQQDKNPPTRIAERASEKEIKIDREARRDQPWPFGPAYKL